MPDQNLSSSELPDLVYLFELDLTFISAGGFLSTVQPRFYFYAAGGSLHQPITTSFIRYTQLELPEVTFYPLVMSIEGLSRDSNGKASRPKLKVTKLDPVVSAIVKAIDMSGKDFSGAGITYNAKFYDTTSSVTTATYNYDFFYISQKTSESRVMLEFELMSPFDVEHITLPKRTITKNTCIWRYKDPETCGWTPVSGKYFSITDTPATESTDQCSKKLTGCVLRFGTTPIRFGGFPAIED